MAGLFCCLFGGSSLGSGDHTVAFALAKDYGYVILVAVISSFLLMWQAMQVGKARKQHKVKYPTMYAADNDAFNCYQRAHQNTLEGYSQFLLLLLFGGLDMPIFVAIGGLIWVAGKVSYSKGYYTGDPKNRMRGAYAYIGLLMLLVATVKLSLKLVLFS
ncbi:microsomal glutathione S-transferase 3-like [Bradysia coprophila]|uniref:microsomal glutathione S-transferase 3-like n=1 Tax=Bradysia coprophila TaxID=38358 RepID=UPI00187DDA16|nr:microsomal glutathione S-transferase 3-like [Bradysia coprophila]XP_037031133.1 microsomal glutathione S-transferase 3-like [Bradysia coprophila]